ncbi:hypothetical protein KAFR_0A03370 [Kazachstania africana CBS 2517]|uniref:DASH complex subunit SPC34 n=1 Tax=Kazachstania africana (strain ATCC 22294 / BCRC 22015 / CBS 2517 / CECT 1963 / NBRC 1671 / NRRL Y-8276) TaxID=1071382 RepID=H2AN22_KAZAF|nr:hypothetical protein KAFR_0A03370 [Kazachstania africana CBS 2517]CCF55772.1 hypothetical protein KAFR_0A03370 [Kazachstania africana CBS 2517]
MSQSLNSCINEINHAVDSLSGLKFKPPGIFHNAVIHHIVSDKDKRITKLLRDGIEREELSLFKIDPKDGILRRRDGKEGVFDHLTERDVRARRNRRLGAIDSHPVIQIPKDFYLKQHDSELSNKRRRTKNNMFLDVDNATSTKISNNTTGAFKLLFSKFKDDEEVTRLLHALQNGSVFIEDDSTPGQSNKRRTTMFVEDFSSSLIFKVLNEIDNLWSLADFKDEYVVLQEAYNELVSQTNMLRSEIKTQENEIEQQTRTKYNISPSADVSRLIAKKRREIEEMEAEIKNIEATKINENSTTE